MAFRLGGTPKEWQAPDGVWKALIYGDPVIVITWGQLAFIVNNDGTLITHGKDQGEAGDYAP